MAITNVVRGALTKIEGHGPGSGEVLRTRTTAVCSSFNCIGRVKKRALGNGRVVARVPPDAKASTILPIIAERVLPASTIFTDDYPIYDGLSKDATRL
jgi:transposase-like protein